MRVKITIQTAEMSDPGGENQGLTRVGYQVVTELAVNIEPMTPALWHKAMHKMSLASSLKVSEVISHTLLFLRWKFLKALLFKSLSWIYLFLFTALRWRP
jgi:hypothetical protein